MKLFKIINLVLLALSVAFQTLPYALIVRSTYIDTYLSYFSITAWANGIIGPFFCAVFSVALFVMIALSFFLKKTGKHYFLTVSVLSWLVLAFSFMPIIFDAYTLIGGVISAISLICAEISMQIYSRSSK